MAFFNCLQYAILSHYFTFSFISRDIKIIRHSRTLFCDVRIEYWSSRGFPRPPRAASDSVEKIWLGSHIKGGPARRKVRKQSRKCRTPDSHWSQVPSTRNITTELHLNFRFCWTCILVWLWINDQLDAQLRWGWEGNPQPAHRTVTYREYYTRCCINKVWPPDDDHRVARNM